LLPKVWDSYWRDPDVAGTIWTNMFVASKNCLTHQYWKPDITLSYSLVSGPHTF
jgi:hypothetical protein